ncbi:hypothetical protein EUBSIR_02179 [[Eubacterium] siraeum DSM 15702]|uniref:Uncharacterized protein n=1 Tax=[Eubacterium] siraeum DSM 15702 TaxID=428128 RepID=B0MQR1_9FIRM|nr:hypothetical protein EUBSIR_02179 [[Eubacterium] siraeum DSM 15702]
MRQLFLCHTVYFLHGFSAPVLKLVIANYIITDFNPAVNQKFRNFQSRPLYLYQKQRFTCIPQTVNKISRILCKNCFRIFYFGIFLPFRIIYFGIFHPFRIFYFAVLLLFRTFCNTHPRFCIKNPAPETSGAGKSPIPIASLTHSCQDL